LLAADGVLVFEHARKQRVPDLTGRLVRIRQVLSGDSSLTIYTLRS
jgi:hypothetical protein